MSGTGWGEIKPEVEAVAAPAETPEDFAKRRDAEILAWNADKEQLSFFKEQEAASRAKVTTTLFPKPKKGTQHYELGAGYKVTLVHGLNYTLGNKDMVNPLDETTTIPVEKQVEALQEAISQLGNEGPFLAERLVRWKPELVEKEYLALDIEIPAHKEAKRLIDEILTIKPASPQLTFVPPKAPK